MNMKDFDGFYFLPGDNENEMQFAYFKVNEEHFSGKPVDGTEIGDMFHIAFFRQEEDGTPTFDEDFEAIFVDPTVYVEGLIGGNLYGCVFRKTEKSNTWWSEYLNRAKSHCASITGNVVVKTA